MKTELVKHKVNRAYNSIGSNIFLEFGDSKEVVFKNGRKTTLKEWSIWIANASWKITKNKVYIVGSGDPRDSIQLYIQNLIGKQFERMEFTSQFLDAQFDFTDGYQLTTFFNQMNENQWTIFFPDQTDIGVDCSTQESIKNTQIESNQFKLAKTYTTQDQIQAGQSIKKITWDTTEQPTIHFENNSIFSLKKTAWRLEKNLNYIFGCLEQDLEKEKKTLNQLIGMKLNRINHRSNLLDMRFEFEKGYILEAFACCAP